MNDREFIELLNLYIDSEISPEDALRLEAEVMTRPDRREVYRQYCRMQKACSMLSEQFTDAVPAEAAAPARQSWGYGPVLAGLAAACLIAVVGLRYRSAAPAADASSASTVAAHGLAVAPVAATPPRTDFMEPVFLTRAPAGRGATGTSFAAADALPQATPLIWIGDVHFSPVVPAANPEFLLAPKADLKAAMLGDIQPGQTGQQAGEMTAFRFQR